MGVAFSVGAKSLSVMTDDGDIHMLDDSDSRFNKIKGLLEEKEPDFDKILKLMDLKATVVKAGAGRVEIGPEGVLFEGTPIGGYMAERLVAMAATGMDVKPWMLFMDNLMENPNTATREDIFKWMEAGKMPITEDGCIVGFKKVRSDYKDVHSGKFSNTVGSVLAMPREQCDEDRNRTCSTGFHFCSADYLSHFSGQRVMVVKIDPRDVTAIPSDYNNAKARCCRYEVTGELSSQAAARHKVFAEPVMPEDPMEIPDLMAKNPKDTTSSRPGPKSPIGQKGGSRKVASNASKAKGLPTPAAAKDVKKAAPAKKTATTAPKKSTSKRKSTTTSKVTKAAKSAVKSAKSAGSKIVEALTEVVSPTTPPTKVTKVKVTKSPAKAKAPVKSKKVSAKTAAKASPALKAPAKAATKAKAPTKKTAPKRKK